MAATPPPRPRNSDPQAQRELIALKAWRDQAVRDSLVALGSIKDSDLTRIVTFGRHDVRQIHGILSDANRHLAEEILEVQLSAAGTAADIGHPPPMPTPLPRRAEPPRTAPTEQPIDQPPQQPTTDWTFAPTRSVDRAPVVAAVKASETAGQLRLEWPKRNDRVIVYRVVSRDDWPPVSPDGGELLAVGTEPTTLDTRPPRRAVRYFSVFANGGYTEQEARDAQPVLIAQGTHYFSLQNLDQHADEGMLNMRWTALPGTVQVRVYRIPVEEAAYVVVPEARHEVDPDRLHLEGILDLTARPGATYRYDLQPEVETVERGETRVVSAPVVSVPVTIPAPLTPVLDLTVSRQLREGLVVYEVSWTRPPAGTVEIFCAPSGPNSGARDNSHKYGALATSLGLDESFRRKDNVDDLGKGTAVMRAVRPNAAWRRIHFTPVTVLGSRVLVGQTVVEIVVDPPGLPEVVERCDYQALKFAWPEGAAKVVTLLRRRDEPVTPITTVQAWFDEIDHDAWSDLGSIQFRHRLPTDGGRIDIAGVAYDELRAEFGPTVSVEYPGLTRLMYRIDQQQRRLLRRAASLTVRVCADRALAPAPTFVLVYRRDRLPLHPGDGQPLLTTPDIQQVRRPEPQFTPDRLDTTFTSTGWQAEVTDLRGFVRLFAVTDLHVALLDPAPQSLILR